MKLINEKSLWREIVKFCTKICFIFSLGDFNLYYTKKSFVFTQINLTCLKLLGCFRWHLYSFFSLSPSGAEPRALLILSKCYTTGPHLPPKMSFHSHLFMFNKNTDMQVSRATRIFAIRSKYPLNFWWLLILVSINTKCYMFGSISKWDWPTSNPYFPLNYTQSITQSLYLLLGHSVIHMHVIPVLATELSPNVFLFSFKIFLLHSHGLYVWVLVKDTSKGVSMGVYHSVHVKLQELVLSFLCGS